MRILYLHGLYSMPGGVKPAFLASRGYEILNPGMPDDDFTASVRIAQEAFDQGRPDVVVGSSRGGAVAMKINSGGVPLVLIAPAWRRWGTAGTVKPGTVVLHSEGDEVVPIDDSRALVAASRLQADALVVAGIDHNMVDEEAFRALIGVLEGSRAASEHRNAAADAEE
jgi:alpha-beta hydrolase superfamily lysophospholipase